MVAPDMVKWDDQTSGDSSRMNLGQILRAPGAYLAALNKEEFVLVVSSDTASGYTINHVYLFAKDGITKIDLSQTQDHTHSGAGDGGDIVNMFTANPKFMDLCLTRTVDLLKANWIQTFTGGGTAEDFTDGTTGERAVRLRPNTGIGDSSSIRYPHLKVDFSKRLLLQMKVQLESTTNMNYHGGTNMDLVTVADTNTQKIGMEVCTALTPPANANWNIRSSNGSGTSLTDTLIAFTTNRVALKVVHLPDLGVPEIDGYVDASALVQ